MTSQPPNRPRPRIRTQSNPAPESPNQSTEKAGTACGRNPQSCGSREIPTLPQYSTPNRSIIPPPPADRIGFRHPIPESVRAEILQIYTGDPEVIRCGMEILSITTVPYFLCGIMDLFPGALRGMGCSAVPMILSVIGTVGTRIVWIFGIFPQHRSLYVLFISYPGSWIITIIMQVICYLIVRKKVHSRAAAV